MKKLTTADVFIPEQIEEALSHLSTKKDTCGIDGLYLSELRDYWDINGERYLSMLRVGKYKPGIVQIYEIINYTGKRRSISSFNMYSFKLPFNPDISCPTYDIFKSSGFTIFPT